MPLEIRKGVQQMVAEALDQIETLTVDEARALLGRPGVTFVDLRDPRELEREGRMPGARNVPRGMLEFWIDPASPYHKPFFASGDTFVFFCAGGWRSALAARTAQEMGLTPVAHIDGGFGAWKRAGAPVEPRVPIVPEPRQ
jgi:rhodanese-related sulfurtransferase